MFDCGPLAEQGREGTGQEDKEIQERGTEGGERELPLSLVLREGEDESTDTHGFLEGGQVLDSMKHIQSLWTACVCVCGVCVCVCVCAYVCVCV